MGAGLTGGTFSLHQMAGMPAMGGLLLKAKGSDTAPLWCVSEGPERTTGTHAILPAVPRMAGEDCGDSGEGRSTAPDHTARKRSPGWDEKLGCRG